MKADYNYKSAYKNYLLEKYDTLSLVELDDIEQIPAVGLKAKYQNNIIFFYHFP